MKELEERRKRNNKKESGRLKREENENEGE